MLRSSLPLLLLATGSTGIVATFDAGPRRAPASANLAVAPDIARGRRPVVIPELPAVTPVISEPSAIDTDRHTLESDPRMWRVDPQERALWYEGEGTFLHEWTGSEGLGSPEFNATHCAACHRDPLVGGAGGLEANVVIDLSQGYYENLGSGFSTVPNARALRDETLAKGKEVPEGRFAEVQTPTVFGLGAIAAIPDSEILAHEDPEDFDGDGIRGRARRIRVNGAEEIGRFGWRASVPRLDDFVQRALGGEHGLTVPKSDRKFGLVRDFDSAQDPEVTPEVLDSLVFFVSHLAPPPRAADVGYEAARGGSIFESIRCSACHVPSLRDDRGEPVWLYSDLLLHDVGTAPLDELTRRRIRQWGSRFRVRRTPLRTPPLWGVSETAPYLSEGSAPTLEAAILAHGGEATSVRQTYEGLLDHDREALLEFLESL